MYSVRVGLVITVSVICAGAAQASTVSDFPENETDAPATFSLASLLQEDALGDECIGEDDIDRAFLATGKGLRLPRTCLPDPCNQALTPFRLAELIGRPAQTAEWDRYFSRYADACRKEIVSFGEEVAEAAPLTKEAFWIPILGAQTVRGYSVFDQTITTVASTSGSAFRFGAPFFFSSGGSGGSGGGIPGTSSSSGPEVQTTLVDWPEDMSPETENWLGPTPTTTRHWPQEPAPSPVPLPINILFLISALLGLSAFRRKRA